MIVSNLLMFANTIWRCWDCFKPVNAC